MHRKYEKKTRFQFQCRKWCTGSTLEEKAILTRIKMYSNTGLPFILHSQERLIRVCQYMSENSSYLWQWWCQQSDAVASLLAMEEEASLYKSDTAGKQGMLIEKGMTTQ